MGMFTDLSTFFLGINTGASPAEWNEETGTVHQTFWRSECWHEHCHESTFSNGIPWLPPIWRQSRRKPHAQLAWRRHVSLYVWWFELIPLCVHSFSDPTLNTECIKIIGAVSICHYGYQKARRSKFPTWNEKAGVQVLCACAIPLPLFSLGLWRNKEIMATPEQKAFCVLQFVKHESVVSVQRAFRRQFNSVPPSPNFIRRWYQQFQATGCLCKGKSAGWLRVSEEGVERVRQSFLRSPKKSNICRHVS